MTRSPLAIALPVPLSKTLVLPHPTPIHNTPHHSPRIRNAPRICNWPVQVYPNPPLTRTSLPGFDVADNMPPLELVKSKSAPLHSSPLGTLSGTTRRRAQMGAAGGS
eukprot:793497-Rhodomonas_salina.1